jgi:DnaK suppressor protein
MSSRTRVPISPAANLASQVPVGETRWAGHREALLAVRDRLRLTLRQGDSSQRAVQPAADALDDKAAAPDPLDGDRGLLIEVEAALKRLEQGTYGRCLATGRPIAEERLRLFPWVRNA